MKNYGLKIENKSLLMFYIKNLIKTNN